MAIQNPWHIAAAAPPPRPKPVAGPQNVGLPGYRPGDPGNPYPGLAAPAPVAEMANVAPPPPPPPPPDFAAMAEVDPRYTTGKADLLRQNELTLAQLLRAFKGQAQGYQDNANAHGALFSGAAVNAQRSAAQGYADQSAQQAQNLQSGVHNLYRNVFDSLLQQLAGGS